MHRETNHRPSTLTIVLLGAAAAFGTYVIVRELPALRRYLRLERM